MALGISILCSHTGCDRVLVGKFPTSIEISILCSHTGCDSNNAQRLHFVYNIALCALPFLML